MMHAHVVLVCLAAFAGGWVIGGLTGMVAYVYATNADRRHPRP